MCESVDPPFHPDEVHPTADLGVILATASLIDAIPEVPFFIGCATNQTGSKGRPSMKHLASPYRASRQCVSMHCQPSSPPHQTRKPPTSTHLSSPLSLRFTPKNFTVTSNRSGCQACAPHNAAEPAPRPSDDSLPESSDYLAPISATNTCLPSMAHHQALHPWPLIGLSVDGALQSRQRPEAN